MKHVASFTRVSTNEQTSRFHDKELKKFVLGLEDDQEVNWCQDKATGTTMDKKAFQEFRTQSRPVKCDR